MLTSLAAGKNRQNPFPLQKLWFVCFWKALEIHVIRRWPVLVFLGVPQEPKELKLTKKLLFRYEA